MSALVIAATGHRPNKLGGYGPDVFDRLVRTADLYLRQWRPDSTISGMALGWDMAFAQASAELGMPFHAAVPFEGQQSQWPASSQRYWEELIKLAASVTIVSPGAYHVEKMQIRNEWMVNRGHRLCALWDGSAGGTGNCVRYAQSNPKVAIDNVWPQWLALCNPS